MSPKEPQGVPVVYVILRDGLRMFREFQEHRYIPHNFFMFMGWLTVGFKWLDSQNVSQVRRGSEKKIETCVSMIDFIFTDVETRTDGIQGLLIRRRGVYACVPNALVAGGRL